MDSVYAVVKQRSTTYCASFLGQAQDVDKWPKVNVAGAKAFADFMVSKNTQNIIKTFGIDKFGAPLFFPDAAKKVEDLGK